MDKTYQLEVQAKLEKLIHLYNLQSEESLVLQLFNLLTRECLAYPITKKLPRFSWICRDATPIQFSVSLSRQRSHILRYIAEVCRPNMLLPERVNISRERIPILLELINSSHLQSIITKVIELLLPSSRLLPDHPKFGVWIGIQHQASVTPILKIYCNLLWRLYDPWSMFYNILRLLDRADVRKKFVKVRNSLGDYCWPSFIGIECSNGGIGRIKLYLRSHQLSYSIIQEFLQELGWMGYESAFAQFHEILLNEQKIYHPRSVIFSITAPEYLEEGYSIKIEFGPRRYIKDDEKVYQRIVDLANELMLDVTPYEQMFSVLSDRELTAGSMRFHNVIGIGFNPKKGPRLNIYLRPELRRYYKTIK